MQEQHDIAKVRKEIQKLGKDADDSKGSIKDLGGAVGGIAVGVAGGAGGGKVVEKALRLRYIR